MFVAHMLAFLCLHAMLQPRDCWNKRTARATGDTTQSQAPGAPDLRSCDVLMKQLGRWDWVPLEPSGAATAMRKTASPKLVRSGHDHYTAIARRIRKPQGMTAEPSGMCPDTQGSRKGDTGCSSEGYTQWLLASGC